MPEDLVLVIDDEPDILSLCERILASEGYSVYTAGSGFQAVEIARETPLDVVVFDVKMPDSDGITVFGKIKSYQPEVVGIVITGYPSMEAAIDALKQGVSGFVLKPFTPNELRQALQDALDRQRLERDYARLQALVPLYDVSRSLMTTVDVEVLLDQVVEIAVQETQANRASLMLEQDGRLHIEAARGLSQDIQATITTPVGEGIAGWVAQHGEPLLLNPDISMPPELADALNREEIGSAVCVPLALHDRVIGVLNLTKLAPVERPFTPSERDLITVLAGQVAIAIENARLFQRQQTLAQELSRANANLRGLQQVATAITSRLSPDRVTQMILDGCATVIEDASVALGLLNPEANSLDVHVYRSETRARDVQRLDLPSDGVESRPSQMFTTLKDRLSSLLIDLTQPASIEVLPLRIPDQQILGAIAVGTPHELSETDVMMLTPFAAQAAVGIANARWFTRIQQAYEELQELDRLKTEFTAIASNGLAAPLSRIKTRTQHLTQQVPADLQPVLNEIVEEANELKRHLDRLVELQRLEAGGPGLQKERIALEDLIASVTQRLKPLVEEKGQTLHVETPDQPVSLDADPAKLEIMLANLMLHASNNSPAAGELGVRVRDEGRELHIIVWDSGPAMSPEKQAAVFEEPLRALDTLTHDGCGGHRRLSTARRLAERHGGHLTVDSQPGRGNTLTLVLPR